MGLCESLSRHSNATRTWNVINNRRRTEKQTHASSHPQGGHRLGDRIEDLSADILQAINYITLAPNQEL